MPAATSRAVESLPLRSPSLIVALAWFIPGGGHFLVGRRGRGAIVLAAVLSCFVLGLLLRGPMFHLAGASDVLSKLIQYGGFIANLASGLPYFLTHWLGYAQPDVAGHDPDYGSKLLVAAGLLNILAMVDAWEIATRRKD